MAIYTGNAAARGLVWEVRGAHGNQGVVRMIAGLRPLADGTTGKPSSLHLAPIFCHREDAGQERTMPSEVHASHIPDMNLHNHMQGCCDSHMTVCFSFCCAAFLVGLLSPTVVQSIILKCFSTRTCCGSNTEPGLLSRPAYCAI